MGARLSLRGVSKTYPGFELRDIDLEVGEGEYFVLLGPTGAGKTLLLETIMGFHPVDEGRILLDGRDITSTAPGERDMGYVPQSPTISPGMTVRENIEFALRRREQDERWERAIDGIIDLMSLGEKEDHRAATLSGGERRKTALARALITQPSTLILDEPLQGIDERARRSLVEDLRRIHGYLGLTIIHVTHGLGEAFALAGRVGVMMGGRLAQTGSPEEIYNHPSDEAVAKFVGYENIYPARLVRSGEGHSVVSVGGMEVKTSETPRRSRVLVAIRNEDIDVSRDYFSRIDDNTVEGTVHGILDHGPTATITADAGATMKTSVSKRVLRDLAIEAGDRVWLTFNARSVRIIEGR